MLVIQFIKPLLINNLRRHERHKRVVTAELLASASSGSEHQAHAMVVIEFTEGERELRGYIVG